MPFWYTTIGVGEEGFDFSIETPTGGTFGPYTSVTSESSRDQRFITSLFNYYHNGRDVDFWGSSNQKREILIDFFGETGTYKIHITRPSAASTAKEFIAILNFSNYAQNPQNGFTNFLVPGNIWDGATAFNNISPTNYVLQHDWTDINGIARSASAGGAIGDIWAGSSIGPTFDGRIGVDVAAPGEFVMTVYGPDSYYAVFDFNKNQEGNGFYGRQGAVSAAAPQVTGIIALMLQVNPELDQIQIRDILRNTARTDSSTGATPNNTWGYGKVDAYAAIFAAIEANFESEVVVSGDNPSIIFNSILGQTYTIEYKDDLSASTWTLLETGLVGEEGQTTYLDQSADISEETQRFYRISLELQSSP